jgi:hypothetical protein
MRKGISALILLVFSQPLFAQSNLYLSNGISTFARWPIIEAGNSVYYLSSRNDTTNRVPISKYFISAVDKHTHILRRSITIFEDTAFSPYEYQPFPISYSFHPLSKRLNIFIAADEDSSASAPSPLKEFPKSIRFLQLDSDLNVVVPVKNLYHFYGNDRYAMSAVNLSIPITGNRTCLSYDVRDTFITDPTSSLASKYLIVDDTGKVLANDFLGWEPLGSDPYFADHFTNGDIYRHYNGQYVVKGIYQDSVAAGRPLLFVLDSSFQLQATFDYSYDETIAAQPAGKHISSYGNLRETFIFLPTGNMVSAAAAVHTNTNDPQLYSYYAVAKGNRTDDYKPTQFYLPAQSGAKDFMHNGTLNFYPVVYNKQDNRLYLYSATESEHPNNFCINGKENAGQISALDTSLNEKWVKYVRPRIGSCIKSFCIAPSDNRAGFLISGIEFSLADSENEMLQRPFIYHVDSLTSLGTEDPNTPVLITDRFYAYPNPATEYIFINNALSEPFSYSISAMNGQIVATGNAGGEVIKVPVSQLNPGVYTIAVHAKSGQGYQLKFSKYAE